MSSLVKIVLIITLLTTALFGQKIVDLVNNNVDIVWPNPTPEPEPAPNPFTPAVIDAPSIANQELVKPIVDIDVSDVDAVRITNFFLELANVVETDPGFITTTGMFREFNMTAGGLNFAGLELKDKYPTLGEAIDAAIVATIGKESKPLDAVNKKALVDCLRAVAWAVHQ